MGLVFFSGCSLKCAPFWKKIIQEIFKVELVQDILIDILVQEKHLLNRTLLDSSYYLLALSDFIATKSYSIYNVCLGHMGRYLKSKLFLKEHLLSHIAD